MVDLFEALINLSESLVDPLLQRLESGIEELDEFLIHGASVAWEEYASQPFLSMRHGAAGKVKSKERFFAVLRMTQERERLRRSRARRPLPTA